MLPWAQFWYNSLLHHSIRMSPFKALYSKDPSIVIQYEVVSTNPISVHDILQAYDTLLQQLKLYLFRA